MANVSLTGFPPVLRISLFQGSGATPGRVVVDTGIVGPANLTVLPREPTLTMAATNFLGSWPLRMVKLPRIQRGFMRTTFEDSRWRLRYATMSGSWNRRDMRGVVATSSDQTIAQLLSRIASASGLTFTTGILPNLKPSADWSGRRASDCLSEILDWAGCRMVYRPTVGDYVISQAGTGASPNLAQRVFRPGPLPLIRNLIVRSTPVLYEDRLPARAVKLDSTGDLVVDTTPVLPTTESFSTQAALRLWEPTAVTFPEALAVNRVSLLPYRPASVVPDSGNSMLVSPELFLEGWNYFPVQRALVHPQVSKAHRVSGTAGGQAILFEHPILGSNGAGGYSKTGNLLCAYHVIETSGELRRNTASVLINAGATADLIKDMDWITPVNSTETDMAVTQWDAIQNAVTAAMASRYNSPPQSIRLAIPLDLGGSGQVGAVHYFASVFSRRIHFSIALNYDPKGTGSNQVT